MPLAGVAPSRRGRQRRHALTLTQYLRFRLGSEGGKTAWFNFFIRPFGASSFAQFWRLWNPVYGYYLYQYSYRPLSRVMPRGAAMLVTFVACGFLLHDLPAWAFARKALPPGGTIAFVLLGIGAILSEQFHMDLSRWTKLGRAAINIAYLAGCIVAMLLMVRWIWSG